MKGKSGCLAAGWVCNRGRAGPGDLWARQGRGLWELHLSAPTMRNSTHTAAAAECRAQSSQVLRKAARQSGCDPQQAFPFQARRSSCCTSQSHAKQGLCSKAQCWCPRQPMSFYSPAGASPQAGMAGLPWAPSYLTSKSMNRHLLQKSSMPLNQDGGQQVRGLSLVISSLVTNFKVRNIN